MQLIPPDVIQVDEEAIFEIDEIIKSIYRLIVFDKNHRNSDVLSRYLDAAEHLRDILSIKNAQQEAQSMEEAEEYVLHLKDGITLIVDEIAASREIDSAVDLFMLLRKISPEAAARTPNQFRKTIVQFGSSTGAMPKDIPFLIEELFAQLKNIRHPIIRAIYLHHELVRIHPFVDGNGRLSRLAKNWILMYNLYPPMFINNYADKKNYIQRLEGSFLSLYNDPHTFNEDTRLFFSDELKRLKASATFVLNRMLKTPNLTIDTTNDFESGQ